MARVPGKNTKLYVNEHNLTGRASMAEFAAEIGLPPVSCFGDEGDEFVEALPNNSIMQNGFFDGDDAEIDDAVWDEIAAVTDALVGLYPGSNAVQGSVGFEIEAQPDDQARPIDVAGAVLLNVTWQGNGPAVRAYVLKNGAVTGSGVITASRTNAGATSSGEECVGILRVLSVTGSGSITVTIEDSASEGGAYSNILTFTAATGVGSERKSTTSATDAWKQVNVTAFSGFSSVTILVVVGKAQRP